MLPLLWKHSGQSGCSHQRGSSLKKWYLELNSFPDRGQGWGSWRRKGGRKYILAISRASDFLVWSDCGLIMVVALLWFSHYINISNFHRLCLFMRGCSLCEPWGLTVFAPTIFLQSFFLLNVSRSYYARPTARCGGAEKNLIAPPSRSPVVWHEILLLSSLLSSPSSSV